MTFFLTGFIGRSEKEGTSNVSTSFEWKTYLCNTKSYCFISVCIQERVFIPEIITYFTKNRKRKFVCTKKVYLCWRKLCFIHEILPSWHEDGNWFRTITPFDIIEHLISFLIVEATSKTDTGIGRYYINFRSHIVLSIAKRLLFANQFV